MSIEVICIDDRPGYHIQCPFSVGDKLHISEVPISVSFQFRFTVGDTSAYCIVDEYPTGGKDNEVCIWYKKRFIPTSNIDEIEFERDYNTVKILK